MEKIKRKMRIQVFDEHGGITEDRLVAQMPEFYKGPEEPYPNGFRVEFHIGDSDDAAKAIDYLRKCSGMVPLNTSKKGRKSTIEQEEDQAVEMSDNQRIELIRHLLNRADQDKLITELRANNFRFISSEFAEELGIVIGESDDTKIGVRKRLYDEYSWMVRTVRIAKDPINDKYDPTVVFGIKIWGERSEKVYVYLYKKLHKRAKVDLPVKAEVNPKNTTAVKYPTYMTYEERSKWRKEHRKVQNGAEPSKFYERWTPDIQFGPEGNG